MCERRSRPRAVAQVWWFIFRGATRLWFLFAVIRGYSRLKVFCGGLLYLDFSFMVPAFPGWSIADRLTVEWLEDWGEAGSSGWSRGHGLREGSGQRRRAGHRRGHRKRLGGVPPPGEPAISVINVGGQDVTVNRLSAVGEMFVFKMNDKCAVGAGRFFRGSRPHPGHARG